MSFSGSPQDNDEEEFGGYVASHRGAEFNSVGGSIASRSNIPRYYQIPTHRPDDIASHLSSPPRLGTPRMRKRRGTPNSKASIDDFSLPAELPPIKDNSFKRWLSSSIIGTLKLGAGVTLATTGQLIAPPLQMTKNILLPGLLALFVDTMDTITPERVKDWLRIGSSSVYHLFTVLTTTEKGKTFSNQFYVVLQDILQALSASEARQAMIDGMACSVKLADALHTPEMLAWLEQMSILGCRLVDAAASGKSKQLLQDTKDLAWMGIETASDPATTVALAEVTAHLCHALEEAQDYLNPITRAQRDAQNRATYLNPFTMSDYPQQVSMEEIILSSLGPKNGAEETDESTVPSNVVWKNDEASADDRDDSQSQGWKDRGVRVDTELLRDRILYNRKPPTRENTTESVAISTRSSGEQPNLSVEALPAIPSQDINHDKLEEATETNKHKNDKFQPNGKKDMVVEESTAPIEMDGDIEDIDWEGIPKDPEDGKPQRAFNSMPKFQRKQADQLPAVLQFYRSLDDMLARRRSESVFNYEREEPKIPYPRELETKGNTQDVFKILRAKVNKLGAKRSRPQRRKETNSFKNLSQKRQTLLACGGLIGLCLMVVWSGFAIYGMLAFVQIKYKSPTTLSSHRVSSTQNSEVLIRIVREVVHVREDGSIIETSRDSPVSEGDIGKVAQCATSVLGQAKGV